MSGNDHIVNVVKNFYNEDENHARYGVAVDKVGLWESEKIIFDKYVSKDANILDLGCGAGRTTINLFKYGYQNIVGLDISDALINYANNYVATNSLAIKFILGDARKLDFADNSFDIVFFSYNGLMCIPDQVNRDMALSEIYRVLKPNGKFIFTAHNRDDSGKHNAFWAAEKIRWENGTNNKDLFQYGDMWTTDQTGMKALIHFANNDEILEMLRQHNFGKVLECTKRSDIATESDIVKEFSGDTVFWVVQK